ncbi:hypothetical protein JM93_01223 [Roseibium hamelinense]|uniref:Uncharacterized protein n=1 Tax=Roseibium hamelinense TaxID=150831 RepID=A0A562TAP1_9HYPH|nr:hypothetical protein [Roseibium hamelinense]MTI45385.1 hypothetical protein [Roseibium hamelinense]TWI90244.1 hypothetical protein JM93_01223 [Roseibium hamelinense]
MGWWTSFKSIADKVIDAVATGIEVVGSLIGDAATATRVADIFETVADAVVNVVVTVAEAVNAVRSATSNANAPSSVEAIAEQSSLPALEMGAASIDPVGMALPAAQDDFSFV